MLVHEMRRSMGGADFREMLGEPLSVYLVLDASDISKHRCGLGDVQIWNLGKNWY